MSPNDDILRRCQRNYDRQEPTIKEECIDEEELDRREAEYQEWIRQVIRHDIRLKAGLRE